jgi:hypothetical protein
MAPVSDIPVIMIVAANWAIQVPIVKVSDLILIIKTCMY